MRFGLVAARSRCGTRAERVTSADLNAAWGAFFSVIPAGRRGPVMAVIDGVPGLTGTIISGVALMLAVSRQALEP